jgi:hypothetical protein
MADFDPNKLKITSKAVAPEYHPEPFYFVQTSNSGATRIPCWSQDPAPLAEVILELLHLFPEQVDVLIKVRIDPPSVDREDDDEWNRFHGFAKNRVVQTAFAKFRKFLLCDSTHQFMVRNPDTGEYFAFDDYGVLWIYSENTKVVEVLTTRGFIKQVQPLIYEGAVWKFTAPNSSSQLRSLVDFLMLVEVQKSDPGEPETPIH